MLTSSSFQFHATTVHHHNFPSTKNTHPLSFHLHNPTLHLRTPSFHRLPPSQHFPAPISAKSPNADKSGEQKWLYEGLITESLPNGMFRVRLDNDDLILGYISGRIRKNYVRILCGDRVRVEVSRYDSSKGRIIYRLRNSPGGGSSS